MRTRDGRALVAVRDHYLSAEIMGINLTYYRIAVLRHRVASTPASAARSMAHYLQLRVASRRFNILLSIQFLGMIIIGGLGSVMGSLMGTAFMVLLPEVDAGHGAAAAAGSGNVPALTRGPRLPEGDGDRRSPSCCS